MYRRPSIQSSGSGEELAVAAMVLIMICVLSVIAGYWYLNDKKEGKSCSGEDENAEYEYNGKRKCIFVSCKNGYIMDSNGVCVVDQSGTACEGSDPNAFYKTDVSNVCVLSLCKAGYILDADGTSCILPPEVDPLAGLETGWSGSPGTGSPGTGGSPPGTESEDCVAVETGWGDCSVPCGSGTRTMTYSITKDETGGGSCPERTNPKTESCNAHSCPIVPYSMRSKSDLPREVRDKLDAIDAMTPTYPGEILLWCMGERISEGNGQCLDPKNTSMFNRVHTLYDAQVDDPHGKRADIIAGHWKSQVGRDCTAIVDYHTDILTGEGEKCHKDGNMVYSVKKGLIPSWEGTGNDRGFLRCPAVLINPCELKCVGESTSGSRDVIQEHCDQYKNETHCDQVNWVNIGVSIGSCSWGYTPIDDKMVHGEGTGIRDWQT